MISIRLPWRPRARPSATLHEIPVYSVKSKLGRDNITDRMVCQAAFHRRNAERLEASSLAEVAISYLFCREDRASPFSVLHSLHSCSCARRCSWGVELWEW